ncbi:hypothetical protein [Kribbella antiqua]|uniref:hypothetical protein n=1 Tax=Kribbella antiqua TaxID=2512217 RepID=UPI001F546AC4|nr:hypothetical protein [Kribbella antiqua]
MRNQRFVVLAAVAGLVLTGCGDESGGAGSTPSSTTPTTTPTPTTPTVTQSTPVSAGLPLTVTRTGGFAGFDDQVVIDADGIATVSSRGKDPVRCKLDPSLLASVTTAAQQVDWAALQSTKPTTKHPDDMIVAVTVSGKTARLEDPKLKPMTAPVSKLLTEAAIPPGKLCKPV